MLRETNGRIVFTSSGAAQHPYVSWGPYGSSKAAMNSLAQHIAVEEPSITTVTVNPGRTDTAMQKEIRDQGKGVMAEAERGTFVTSFEQGKLNKPEGPGHVMAKLVIDASQDLSGKFLRYVELLQSVKTTLTILKLDLAGASCVSRLSVVRYLLRGVLAIVQCQRLLNR